MRYSLTGFAVAAAFVLTIFPAVRADQAQSQSRTKGASKAAPPTYGNSDAISEEELKIHLYFLSADQLEGRNLPSRGYDIASLYVATQLAGLGLKPMGSTSGTNGPLQPYFMPMELVARQVVTEESKLTLTAPAGGGRGAPTEPRPVAYPHGKDWTVAAAGGRGGGLTQTVDVTGNLVFAGNGYVINKTKVNPYEGLDVKGKIVVVAGLPAELAALQQGGRGGRGGRGGEAQAGGAAPAANGPAAQQPAAAQTSPLGEACTDYFSPEQYAARNGALGVVNIATFAQATTMGNPAPGAGRGPSPNGPNFTPVRFAQTPACPAAPSVTAGLTVTTALFQGEKLSASQVFYGTGTNTRLDSFELSARKTLNIRIPVKSEQGHAQNIIGMLEGSDPVLKNEFVVLTAHLDHIGFSATAGTDTDNINNGADDDGSGCAGLLGIAKAYSAGAAKGIRPKRSVIFMWLGGEEKGLWGSRYFTQFPPIDITRVVANINMDMIGRTKTPSSADSNPQHVLVNPGELLVIGPNISSEDLGKTIDTVNGNYQKLTMNHFYDVTAPDATHDNLGPQPNGQRIFYRSDHYNFAKMGIPIAFFTTGLHVDYHRPSDTPDKIDYKAMQTISKTVAAITWELATQPNRPKLNEKLPDQLIKDMKAAREAEWGRHTPVLPPLPGMPF